MPREGGGITGQNPTGYADQETWRNTNSPKRFWQPIFFNNSLKILCLRKKGEQTVVTGDQARRLFSVTWARKVFTLDW